MGTLRLIYIHTKMLRVLGFLGASASVFGAPSTCSQQGVQLCNTAFTSICQTYTSVCDGSLDCLLEVEGLYQDALTTLSETENCQCEQESCIDWSHVKAPQGLEMTEEQKAQMPIYEQALKQYENFSDETAMQAALEGNNDGHLPLILLIIHKNNQNGLLKFIILRKTGIFGPDSDTSGVVKFIILKKLFGDSDTLLKLFLLHDVVQEKQFQQCITIAKQLFQNDKFNNTTRI